VRQEGRPYWGRQSEHHTRIDGVANEHRSINADDIGPQLRRMHADIDPQLRRMQNQLDNIESAVNLALASRYAELSQLAWAPAIPAPRANDKG
jgi:hypothetical protein